MTLSRRAARGHEAVDAREHDIKNDDTVLGLHGGDHVVQHSEDVLFPLIRPAAYRHVLRVHRVVAVRARPRSILQLVATPIGGFCRGSSAEEGSGDVRVERAVRLQLGGLRRDRISPRRPQDEVSVLVQLGPNVVVLHPGVDCRRQIGRVHLAVAVDVAHRRQVDGVDIARHGDVRTVRMSGKIVSNMSREVNSI